MKPHVLFLTLAFALGCSADHVTRTKLMTDLFTSYDKDTRPTNITLIFSIALLCGRYSESDGKLWTSAWEKYAWTDNRLVWEPEEYGGITGVKVSPDLVFKPALRLFQSSSPKTHHGHVKIILKHNGTLLWFPPVMYETECKFSEDRNSTCPYKLGLWAYSHYDTPLVAGEMSMEHYDKHCPYLAHVTKSEVEIVKYACSPEDYSSFELGVNYSPNPDYE